MADNVLAVEAWTVLPEVVAWEAALPTTSTRLHAARPS